VDAFHVLDHCGGTASVQLVEGYEVISHGMAT
jgi:hypothetical protein